MDPGRQRGPALGQPSPADRATFTKLDTESISASLPGYVVVMITKYGMPRRKVYLDLGHARAAVARSRGKGQQAWLILCELTPVQADLGEWSE